MTTEKEPQRPFLPDLCTARSVLVVVVGGQLLAFVLVLAAAYHEGFSYQRLGTTSLFIQWVGLTSTAILCLLRELINRLPPSSAALMIFAVVVLNTLVFSILARLLLAWALAGGGEPGIGIWRREVLINVAIAAIIAGVVMRYFYVQEQLRAREEAELQSRIQALQSRIRPHFLFNSMNTISSLIAVDPEAAEQAVEDLSGLFRASLADSEGETTLDEELALCRRYVRIESLRMGERLQAEWDIRCEPARIPIPLLTLQPLLENAIYHGVQPLPKGGRVTVSARVENDELVLEVRNPVPAGAAARQSGNRMALENIRHRLAAVHEGRARVDAGREGDEYRVCIRYPLERSAG